MFYETKQKHYLNIVSPVHSDRPCAGIQIHRRHRSLAATGLEVHVLVAQVSAKRYTLSTCRNKKTSHITGLKGIFCTGVMKWTPLFKSPQSVILFRPVETIKTSHIIGPKGIFCMGEIKGMPLSKLSLISFQRSPKLEILKIVHTLSTCKTRKHIHIYLKFNIIGSKGIFCKVGMKGTSNDIT